MNYTRRDVGKLALASLPAARLLAKPNSKFGGVQIGINAPYSFKNTISSGDEVLNAMLQLGLNAVKLRSQRVEGFLGVPANLTGRGAAGRGPAAGAANVDLS